MRRSFGGRGMGGGSGGMMRTVQRAVRAGVGGAPPEPFSPSTTTNIAAANASTKSRKGKNLNNKQPTSPNAALSHSSSSSSSSGNGRSAFSSLINLPASATSGVAAPTWPGDSSSEWECVEDEERARVFYDDFVFGTAPSTDEVHHAVSALQQVIRPSSYGQFPNTNLAENIGRDEVVGTGIGFERLNSSPECEMDRIEPLANDYNSKILQPHGSNNRAVYDAFHLLQTETSVQRMVISLSSDKALWDAVMNNEAVKDIRRSLHQDENVVGESSGEGSGGSNPVKDLLSWIVVNAKSKMMQLIDTMAKFVSQYFELQNEEKKEDPTDEKLKTSLLLSIIVLFVVVVTRAQGA